MQEPNRGTIIKSVQVHSVAFKEENNIETLTLELKNCTITSLYKPANMDFEFSPPTNLNDQKVSVVIGDFNSHSHVWGYAQDKNGEAVLN